LTIHPANGGTLSWLRFDQISTVRLQSETNHMHLILILGCCCYKSR